MITNLEMAMSSTEQTTQTDPDGKGEILTVEVFAPRDPEHPKTFEWDKHLLVSTAAAEAAAAFGYVGGAPALSKGKETLDPALQLHQAGVKSGDTLDLLDNGGGV